MSKCLEHAIFSHFVLKKVVKECVLLVCVYPVFCNVVLVKLSLLLDAEDLHLPSLFDFACGFVKATLLLKECEQVGISLRSESLRVAASDFFD